jgi:hypothetical protein
MVFLLANAEIYIYDCRILRWISYIMALVFDFIYICMIGNEINNIYYNISPNITEANLYDLLFAIILGFFILSYLPTFLVNTFIILKELTMS